MKKAKRKSVPNENERNEQLVGETETCVKTNENELLAKAGFAPNKTPQEIEIEKLLAKGRVYKK